MEDLCELLRLHAHRDGHLQAEPPTIYVRLHLVALRGPAVRLLSLGKRLTGQTHLLREIKVRLRGHEERGDMVETVLLLPACMIPSALRNVQERERAYPQVADIRERVRVARVVDVHDDVCQICLLRVPQRLRLILRPEFLQLHRCEHAPRLLPSKR